MKGQAKDTLSQLCDFLALVEQELESGNVDEAADCLKMLREELSRFLTNGDRHRMNMGGVVIPFRRSAP